MNRVGNRYRQVWCCMQHRIFVKRLRKPTETHHHHHRQTDITILSFYCLFVILLTVHGFSCFLFSSPKMEWRTTSRLCSIKPGYWKTKKLQSIHGLPQKRKRTCFHWMNAQVYEWRAGNTIGILLCVKYCRPKPFHITM